MLEPLSDLNASLDMLTSTFAPLYTESWVKRKAALYGGKQFDMNVNVFANMWFSRALRIFMAYEDGKPVGYILAMLFRPLTHQSSIMQLEDWYGAPGVLRQLFEYTETAAKFIGIDEIWISHNAHEEAPALSSDWRKRHTTVIDRYAK